MKTDYTYCLNQDTCIHRRGCRRWVGNYSNEQAKELANSCRDEYIVDKDCMESEPMPFALLDRFRGSDGSPK